MQKVDTEPYLSTDSLSNQSDVLTEVRIKNPKQLIIAHLNIIFGLKYNLNFLKGRFVP